ncbi:hypothetical protein [Entomohabitans teleogrylli]|uniref:hypothetical protein n=1 Tax=Entomohabitans teleogrylli TaxID=1384589 RepID=UPI00073DB5A0|nr:hypothetical protein [Entomohabitans teleogrylli]
MLTIKENWNPLQRELKNALACGDAEQAKAIACQLHGLVHTASVSNRREKTFQDEILGDVSERAFRHLCSPKYQGYRTLAFFVFHMTRIEDICANVLIANDKQVIFESAWLQQMNIPFQDTGNAMTENEMKLFSASINREALLAYRRSVGRKTQKIIQRITASQLKTRPDRQQIARVLSEKSVLEHRDSIWLLDYWQKKNIGGLLMMPLTKHQILHLNDCLEIIKKGKRISQSC